MQAEPTVVKEVGPREPKVISTERLICVACFNRWELPRVRHNETIRVPMFLDSLKSTDDILTIIREYGTPMGWGDINGTELRYVLRTTQKAPHIPLPNDSDVAKLIASFTNGKPPAAFEFSVYQKDEGHLWDENQPVKETHKRSKVDTWSGSYSKHPHVITS